METPPDIINSTLKVVSEAADAVAGLAGSWKALQVLFKASELRADPDIVSAMADPSFQVANTKIANSDLNMQITALHDSLVEAQNFEKQLERHELREAPAGAIIYRLRKSRSDSGRDNEPAHFLCPHCVQVKRKSILQGNARYKSCHPCGAEFEITPLNLPASGRSTSVF